MTLTGQIAVLLAATVIAVPLFRRLRLSAVLAYLASGIVSDPGASGPSTDVDSILQFAEFGVVLLLFVIGLELQPSRLLALRRVVFGLGAAQVLLTTAVLAGYRHAARPARPARAGGRLRAQSVVHPDGPAAARRAQRAHFPARPGRVRHPAVPGPRRAAGPGPDPRARGRVGCMRPSLRPAIARSVSAPWR